MRSKNAARGGGNSALAGDAKHIVITSSVVKSDDLAAAGLGARWEATRAEGAAVSTAIVVVVATFLGAPAAAPGSFQNGRRAQRQRGIRGGFSRIACTGWAGAAEVAEEARERVPPRVFFSLLN
jgi:hypothetical protein